jgi:hypothetical protein
MIFKTVALIFPRSVEDCLCVVIISSISKLGEGWRPRRWVYLLNLDSKRPWLISCVGTSRCSTCCACYACWSAKIVIYRAINSIDYHCDIWICTVERYSCYRQNLSTCDTSFTLVNRIDPRVNSNFPGVVSREIHFCDSRCVDRVSLFKSQNRLNIKLRLYLLSSSLEVLGVPVARPIALINVIVIDWVIIIWNVDIGSS